MSRKLAFILEEFAPGSPAQHLLDRIAIGYPLKGEFHKFEDLQIVVVPLATVNADARARLNQRVKQAGIKIVEDLAQALRDADAAIIVWKGKGSAANHDVLQKTLKLLRPDTRLFVHGVLANSSGAAQDFARLAFTRQVVLTAATSAATTFRLPNVDLPQGAILKDALVVTHGNFPDAEFEAAEALFPIIQRRKNGEAGLLNVVQLAGSAVWTAGDDGQWSRALLESAVSRSNNIKGDPEKDGRTQDIVGLRLIEYLAREPRAWMIQHTDGLKSAILVLNGAIGDMNFAVGAADGKILSAQLYRPPAPNLEEFSNLAAAVEDFFISGQPPWPLQRALFIAFLVEQFKKLRPA